MFFSLFIRLDTHSVQLPIFLWPLLRVEISFHVNLGSAFTVGICMNIIDSVELLFLRPLSSDTHFSSSSFPTKNGRRKLGRRLLSRKIETFPATEKVLHDFHVLVFIATASIACHQIDSFYFPITSLRFYAFYQNYLATLLL